MGNWFLMLLMLYMGAILMLHRNSHYMGDKNWQIYYLLLNNYDLLLLASMIYYIWQIYDLIIDNLT